MRIMNINIHFVNFSKALRTHRPGRRGYTLVEMLLSVVLTLTLMYGVAEIFSMVGNSVNDSRALLGIGDRLRATQARLQLDLDGVTSHMTPPAKPENNEGYFELIEGPVGPTLPLISTTTITSRVRNTDEAGNPQDDTTAIDYDDILMFTTRTTTNEPFIGRAVVVGTVTVGGVDYLVPKQNTVESRFAEVAWFVRGRTLYRRVKIIKPDFVVDTTTPGPPYDLTCNSLYGGTTNLGNLANGLLGGAGGNLKDPNDPANKTWSIVSDVANPVDAAFENLFDLSTHVQVDTTASPVTWEWIPNSLSDLTKRENRMYHSPAGVPAFDQRFPHCPYYCYVNNDPSNKTNHSYFSDPYWTVLGLPTLAETSNLNWMLYQWSRFAAIGGPELPTNTLGLNCNVADLNVLPNTHQLDFWNAPYPYDELDPNTGNLTDDALLSLVQVAVSGAVVRPHQRVGEDVILNNVIGFDVKVWDPGAPILSYGNQVFKPGDPGYPSIHNNAPYDKKNLSSLPSGWAIVGYGAFVDLGYGVNSFTNVPTELAGYPEAASGFRGPDATTPMPVYIYDTWSTHYEFDGVNQNQSHANQALGRVFVTTPGIEDRGHNGVDDNLDTTDATVPNGLVDDPAEFDTLPPYPVPLQAIQIKIRVFEPESQQVREVTIVHKF